MVSIGSEKLVRVVCRVFIGGVGAVMLYLTLALFLQLPSVDGFWPWTSYSTGLSSFSFIFLSSIAAAICAPLIWIALTGSLHAATSGAMNLAVAFGGIAGFIFMSHLSDPTNPRLLPAALLLGFSALANLVIAFAARRLKLEDARPLPLLIKGSFWVFSVVLILVGTALVMEIPNVVPWEVTREGSIIYGWIFLGAAVYFLYAIWKPLWDNAVGPLWGFLAYDLILIVPFIRRFSDVPDEQRLSLIIYTGVVSYSGLLAIYFLFIHRKTRLWKGVAGGDQVGGK